MKMAGQVLRWRWLCSSSWSPGLNRNLLSRAFSAPDPSRVSKISVESESKPKSNGGKTAEGLMDEAKGSENWELFKSWMFRNNRIYRSEEEMLQRFQIFSEKLKRIEKENKESNGCTFGLNGFSDMTVAEYPRGYCPPPGERPYKLSKAARCLDKKKSAPN